jgi:sortase A
MKVLHWSEELLVASGLACIVFYVWILIYSTAMSRASLWSFSQLETSPPSVTYERHVPEFERWAEGRVAAYKRALAVRIGAPLAVLSIPRLGLDVPVFEGTGEVVLDHGAGRIAGTARLGEPGNIAIAAHRDGFFRGLKGIRQGDRIELAQMRRKFTYTVDRIVIVNPSDTTVLQARARPSLTLVTCYPFYFVGDAPQRYVVQASLTKTD